MAKRTKKAIEERIYGDGFYTARLNANDPDEAEFRELEVRGGVIVSIDGEEDDRGLSVDRWVMIQGGGEPGAQTGSILIGEQKNAPESVAAETETGSNPDEETQTSDSIAKKKNIRKPVLRTLRFPLSADEIEAKCAGASKKSRAVGELETEFARVKSDYKGRIEKLENEIRSDLRAVEDRAEHREVMCDEIHDFDAMMVRWVFNGDTYEQREMTPRERQMVIEGVL
jgi:hypothetical protein